MQSSENIGAVDPARLEKLTQEQLEALGRLHARFLEGRVGGRRAVLKNTDLSNLSLRGYDMRQASFTGCDMGGMDLRETNFQEASLYACDLSGANLYKTRFVRADLRGARIENANLEGADLEKADLRVGGIADEGGTSYDAGRAVNFRGANLSGAKLAGSMASKADFSDALMAGANVANADLRGAQLEGADLSDAEIEGVQLDGANLKSTILTGVEVKQVASAGADLSEAITDDNIGKSVRELEDPLPNLVEEHRQWVKTAGQQGKQLDLSDIDMRSLKTLKAERLTAIKAMNAKFFGMNLFKVQLQSAALDFSDFRNCDLEEADLRGSSFKGVQMSHAKMKGVNGSPLLFGTSGPGQRFSPCDFTQARLRYTDLSDAQLKSAVFKGADLSYADLSNADLREADFSGANLTGSTLDNAQTEGAIFDKGANPVFRIPGEGGAGE